MSETPDNSTEWYSGPQLEEMTLRQIVEAAANAIDTYKHPDISEFRRRIDELLKAGKMGGIASDDVTSISINTERLSIWTSYSVRSCDQTAHYEIPLTIIDATDPLEAMLVWAHKERVAKARGEVKEAERRLAFRKEQLAEIESQSP